jgi:hypothetical protein
VRHLGIAAGAVAVIVTLAILVRDSRETTDPNAHHRFTIPLPDSVVDGIAPEDRIPVAQTSPDGKLVAFIVRSVIVRRASRIWLQRLDDLRADEITGSEGARSLFWALDSQKVGFFAGRAVKMLTVSNGTVQPLCEACDPAISGSGTWSRTGLIVFPVGGWTAARYTPWRRGTPSHNKPNPGGAETRHRSSCRMARGSCT